MGPPTDGTFDPTNRKPNGLGPVFDPSGIIPMNFQASGMPTGAGKSVELNGSEQVIIKILRNRIGKISR